MSKPMFEWWGQNRRTKANATRTLTPTRCFIGTLSNTGIIRSCWAEMKMSGYSTYLKSRFYFGHSLLGAAEEYALWMKAVVRTKFKHTILLNLNVTHGSWYDATKGSENPPA